MPQFHFQPEDLFIFEMANNHQGSVEHGLRMIRAAAQIAHQKKLLAGIKFQMRDLKTFLNPNWEASPLNRHVQRFLQTELSLNDFQKLKDEVHNCGLLSICTPFDEASVQSIFDMNFDIIKIASCSTSDIPLLTAIKKTQKPVIASTAGLSLEEVDRLVDNFSANQQLKALLHCVALYPTPIDQYNLTRIRDFKLRYPGLQIGYSTHESPEEMDSIKVAYALGARVFEKHFALPDSRWSINTYSATPEQLTNWLDAFCKTRRMCASDRSETHSQIESRSIKELARGIFAKHEIKKGDLISLENVNLQFPIATEDQLLAGDLTDSLMAHKPYSPEEPVLRPKQGAARLTDKSFDPEKIVKNAIRQLDLAQVKIPESVQIEISHHYGPENFTQTGAVIFRIFKDVLEKKVLYLGPGQVHPKHKHDFKYETYYLHSGDLEVEIDGQTHKLIKGGTLSVPPYTWHKFLSRSGAVIEEITFTEVTSAKADSFYEDPIIQSAKSRKTLVDPQRTERFSRSIET